MRLSYHADKLLRVAFELCEGSCVDCMQQPIDGHEPALFVLVIDAPLLQGTRMVGKPLIFF